MKKSLTMAEEKYLYKVERWHKNSEKPYFLVLVVVFSSMSFLSLFMAFHFKDIDPVMSRDHFWLTGVWSSTFILAFSNFHREKKLFAIIQKLKVEKSYKLLKEKNKANFLSWLTGSSYPW